MPARPRLSVVVPCHDVARFVPELLACVDANAADDIEWLLVDDGSKDDTPQLLSEFTPRAGTARVLTNSTAQGLSEARNTATRVAEGRYLTFLDGDDWYARGYATRLADAIEGLQVDFVRVDHVQTRGVLRSVHRSPETRRGTPLAALDGIGTDPVRSTMVDYPNAWSAVYDLRLRDRGLLFFDPALRTSEDRYLTWRLHMHADTYAAVGLLGYFYRRDVEGSLTTVGDERQLHFFDAFDSIWAELRADSAFAPYLPKFVRAYLTLIAHHERQRARLRPEVHRSFRSRATATIRALPGDLADGAIATLDPRRRAILEALR